MVCKSGKARQRFAAGAVVHTGPQVFELGERILAVPRSTMQRPRSVLDRDHEHGEHARLPNDDDCGHSSVAVKARDRCRQSL